jgi:hypothetical protein
MSATEHAALATDIATYLAAVSTGVSANALTDSAKTLIEKVRGKVSHRAAAGLVAITPEMVEEVAALLAADAELLEEASRVMARPSIDRSIIVNSTNVYGVSQTNN